MTGVTNAHAARPRFEQFTMATQAAICDLGVALLPKLLIEDELSSASYSLTGPFEARIPIILLSPSRRLPHCLPRHLHNGSLATPSRQTLIQEVDVDLSTHEQYS
jgi:DNA-binding transcriptional LysR family regulator